MTPENPDRSRLDSFGSRAQLKVGERTFLIHRIDATGADVRRLPYTIRVLLENLLRHEDGVDVTGDDVSALAHWSPTGRQDREVAFHPARILLQDFTGVPVLVDLAAMRDAVEQLGGDPARVNPQVPAELVIDHSIQVDYFATPDAFERNAELEYRRNAERYAFLRWGQQAFDNMVVVPPDTGICHQVNLEYLARVVFVDRDGNAYPDTLVGTDSHTPMVNGLGVLGWGVGGIEAEAAMLGQPIPLLTPAVVGVRLTGALAPEATATDLVLTITEFLRRHGVVGKFVEFFGPGVASLPLETRATIGNMSPEYGSTVTIFPIDEETLRYLRFTGRSEEQVALVEAYAKEQGLWHEPDGDQPDYTETLELDLTTVEPCIAGPARPQDRIPLKSAKERVRAALGEVAARAEGAGVAVRTTGATDGRGADSSPPDGGVAAEERPSRPTQVTLDDGTEVTLDHGHVVIAAITSCTNTSNPQVMVAAGLLAKAAVERGLTRKPWVKTSLAPGSQVVIDYLEAAGLMPYLEKLGFSLVGYGCTTCIGNSGPLPGPISEAVRGSGLAVAAVLSGNRNFEGRINPDVRMNFLASPPLVVAYAIAGTTDIDLYTEPLGVDSNGTPVMLRDIWPSPHSVDETVRTSLRSEMFRRRYAGAMEGDERWRSLPVPGGNRYDWSEDSTYVRRPPFFDGIEPTPKPPGDIVGARALVVVGDSVTTDHISPAGSIPKDGPAGRWLIEHGVDPSEFNSFGARRGNHEVMMRGTFANLRLRNRLAPGTEGGWTVHLPDGELMTVWEAAERYREEKVPLIVLGGKEYGSGSSRDWAAKGTALLGVRAVLAESFERIHRSNLVGMGVLPLELPKGETVDSLGLDGRETYSILGLEGASAESFPQMLRVVAEGTDGRRVEFDVNVRVDTPSEVRYFLHGGILPYVARRLAGL
ncbi:MAG: aconitate hydratase [Acidimicrobiales bacterium]|nr:MAG: aconitate hydratase [Acidimicrobiales bacterium]